MTALNFLLLCAAIFLLLILAVPEPQTCWLPPNAPSRGMYVKCWSISEVLACHPEYDQPLPEIEEWVNRTGQW